MVRASLLALLLTLCLVSCYSGSRPPHIGSPAPDFTVQDAGRSLTLSQFRGKTVVLNFWATWCPPCVEEMPSLVQMQQKLGSNGVEVVAVSIDDDEQAYRHFLKDHNVTLTTIRDPQKTSANLYGTSKWPETYIIDRDGIVRRKFIGPQDWLGPEIIDFLKKL